jgi:hypothetical protein
LFGDFKLGNFGEQGLPKLNGCGIVHRFTTARKEAKWNAGHALIQKDIDFKELFGISSCVVI